jgi:general L-amino acid transport system permease protein
LRRLQSAARACISSPINAAVTALILLWLATTVPDLVRWALLGAVWSGQSPRACEGVNAACWLFIGVHFREILIGAYPAAAAWRVILCLALGAAIVSGIALPWRRHKVAVALGSVLLFPPVAGILLYGGVFGLPIVTTERWGGLLLTVVVAAWTIASTLPAGLVLALARRSTLPVVAKLAALYIDIMRGLPLIGILFVAIILFPLFVPPGTHIDALLRVLIAFSLFNAAIMAEVMRGALQSVPTGQYEAARALGLGHWQTMALSIIPQATRAALPGIINVSIAIIKETTIILIAGMFDFLGVLQNALIDPQWLVGDQVRQTAYFFVGLVFFVICFSLSWWSTKLEKRLGRSRIR